MYRLYKYKCIDIDKHINIITMYIVDETNTAIYIKYNNNKWWHVEVDPDVNVVLNLDDIKMKFVKDMTNEEVKEEVFLGNI